MPFTITKKFSFEAAHALTTVPAGHKCSDKFEDGSPGRVHGHSWIVIVKLRSEDVDERGFVLDYGELSLIREWIDRILDHRNLNDVCDFPTTSENLARWIYQTWATTYPELVAVTVCETAKTTATYSFERGLR